jgi:hypothetical protein
VPFRDLTRHREADRRIVDRLGAMGAVIVDAVTQMLQRALEMLFEKKSGVIRADRNQHDSGIVLCSHWPKGFAPDIPDQPCVVSLAS